ncbi:MAG TPA: biopolymer transporter ExbD, partial [Croceibacterium sp.]
MAFASASSAQEPLSEINTTPLIDVLLVLLIVLVMAVPLATNSLEVDLPGPVPPIENQPLPVRNLLAIETDGDLLWNGRAIDERELAVQLALVRAMAPEPEVQFRPEADASYARSTEVLLIVKRSRITKFGFVGNEQYRT